MALSLLLGCDETGGRGLPGPEEVDAGLADVRLSDDGGPSNDSGSDACLRALGLSCERFEEAYLKAPVTDLDDFFGAAVALDGDTLAVGAINDDSGATGVDGDPNNDDIELSGAVHVFVRSGRSWQHQAYLKASNTGPSDRFGSSLALDGDTLVVGAPEESSAATGVDGDQANDEARYSGAAYVFARSEGVWAQQAYLKADNSNVGVGFGCAVAVAGDTVAVGFPWESSSATGLNGDSSNREAGGSGAVYLFERRGDGWFRRAYLKASNSGELDLFGASVALKGARLVVGAPGEDGATDADDEMDRGAVYVFSRSAGEWRQEALIRASGAGPGRSFGLNVDLEGETLVVGARQGTGSAGGPIDDAASAAGAVYVFARSADEWVQEAQLEASNADSGDDFGTTVALSGDLLAVGAPKEDSAARGVDGDQSSNASSRSGAAQARPSTSSLETNVEASGSIRVAHGTCSTVAAITTAVVSTMGLSSSRTSSAPSTCSSLLPELGP